MSADAQNRHPRPRAGGAESLFCRRAHLSLLGASPSSLLPSISAYTNSHQLEFSIFLSTIATTLLNFSFPSTFSPSVLLSSSSFPTSPAAPSYPSTSFSTLPSLAFTLLAILALLYSAGIYYHRVRMLRLRRAVRYHDKWGPSVLCLGLAVGLGVGAWSKFFGSGKGTGTGKGRS